MSKPTVTYRVKQKLGVPSKVVLPGEESLSTLVEQVGDTVIISIDAPSEELGKKAMNEVLRSLRDQIAE